MLPSVEVSLSPPGKPLPAISAEIAKLETAREASELAFMNQVQHEAQIALASTKTQIYEVAKKFTQSFVDRSLQKSMAFAWHKAPTPMRRQSKPTSFLEKAVQPQTAFRVTVKNTAKPDKQINHLIRASEAERSTLEEQFFDQAIAEIREIPHAFAKEMQAQISMQARDLVANLGSRTKWSGFLEKPQSSRLIGHQANVRVAAPDSSYPTVESLVKDMQTRRNDAEELLRNKVAMAKLVVLQSANSIAKEVLAQAVQEVSSRVDSLTN